LRGFSAAFPDRFHAAAANSFCRRWTLDCSTEVDYTTSMVVQSIREFNRAVPFRPYQIRMVSGECYKVPHPDFLFISPKGSYVVFVDARESPHHLSSFLIESVSLQTGRRGRKSGKRS
jgi:hypothetical protein